MSYRDFLPPVAALLIFAGHCLLWIEFVNHAHATRMPRWAVWILTLLGYGALVGAPALVLLLWLAGPLPEMIRQESNPAVKFYAGLCAVLSLVLGPLAIAHRRRRKLPNATQVSAIRHDIGQQLGLRIAGTKVSQYLNYFPGNEALTLEVTCKRIELARLPSALDGLTLCHLTDLHYTGRVPRAFFEQVVDQANALQPDVMLITGDIVDKSPCLDWLRPTLERLRAAHGVYYILGNHDKRVPVEQVRGILADCGLISVSGRSLLVEVRGGTILLAGNELPWLPPAADMSRAPLRPGDRPHLRLLLSHSPDQYGWARGYQFDLMLSGHNHGGQITLPIIGPVAVPSRHGVKYASGLFYEAPTVLHVSRGISSELPLRCHCPPELALLELHTQAMPSDA